MRNTPLQMLCNCSSRASTRSSSSLRLPLSEMIVSIIWWWRSTIMSYSSRHCSLPCIAIRAMPSSLSVMPSSALTTTMTGPRPASASTISFKLRMSKWNFIFCFYLHFRFIICFYINRIFKFIVTSIII